MFICQYVDLLREVGFNDYELWYNHYQYGFPADRYTKTNLNVPVHVAEGKLTGKVLPIREIAGAKVKVEDEKGKLHTLLYTQVDRVDSLRRPIIEPIRDMTGRAIKVDDWIAYMAHNPQSNGSGIGIAKIVDSDRKGQLSVQVAMFDGERVADSNELRAFRAGPRPLANPRRALRLPIDGQDLLVLFMNDFERFTDDP